MTLSRTVTAVLCLLAITPAWAVASRTQTVTFEAPRDLLDPAYRDGAFTELDALGVRALRMVLYWHDVAPGADATARPQFDAADPAAYDWSRWEPALDEARRRGWSVLLTISGPVPRWASAGARSTVHRPSATEFEQFVTAVARQFGDRVTTWSVWNEPNHPKFLAPQYERGRPASPRIYRGLYAAALRGLATAGDTKPVLMGETAPRGTGAVVAPLRFLRGALCLSGRYRRDANCRPLRVDGWAHHAYTTRQGPLFVPPGRQDVTIGVIGRLTRALDRAARAGALPRALPVHLTEFGIQSEPDPLSGVSEIRQEEYRATSERIAFENPRVAAFSQYLLRDDDPVAGAPRIARYGGFESGLRTAGGRAKLSFHGFRLPLAARRGRRAVSLWGLVRPAAGGQAITVESSDDGGRAWVKLATVATDAAGAWRKQTRPRRGRRYRVAWIAPDGTQLHGAPTRDYRAR